MFFLALSAFIFIGLLIWSATIAWHLHTYVVKDDEMHTRMLKIFIAGNAVFLVVILSLFAAVPWKELSLEALTVSLSGQIETFLQ
ncbi:MAG: hypothetical protein Q8Q39_03285 [bacterium]|nr:hypothetical protein [bacterium]